MTYLEICPIEVRHEILRKVLATKSQKYQNKTHSGGYFLFSTSKNTEKKENLDGEKLHKPRIFFNLEVFSYVHIWYIYHNFRYIIQA